MAVSGRSVCKSCGGLQRYKNGRCVSCSRRKASKWQKLNVDSRRIAKRTWRQNNPERVAEYKRKTAYGLPLGGYQRLFETQRGMCAICGREGVKFDVDHCHSTNKIRGLLCRKCNLVLGLVNDDLVLLEKAITYLRSFR